MMLRTSDPETIAGRIAALVDLLFAMSDAPLARVDAAETPDLAVLAFAAERCFSTETVAGEDDRSLVVEAFGLMHRNVATKIDADLQNAVVKLVADQLRSEQIDPDLISRQYLLALAAAVMATDPRADRRRHRVGEMLRSRVLMLDEACDPHMVHPQSVWALILIEFAADDSAYNVWPSALLDRIVKDALSLFASSNSIASAPAEDQIVIFDAALDADLPHPLPDDLQFLTDTPIAAAPRYGFAKNGDGLQLPAAWMQAYLSNPPSNAQNANV